MSVGVRVSVAARVDVGVRVGVAVEVAVAVAVRVGEGREEVGVTDGIRACMVAATTVASWASSRAGVEVFPGPSVRLGVTATIGRLQAISRGNRRIGWGKARGLFDLVIERRNIFLSLLADLGLQGWHAGVLQRIV